MGKKVVLTGKKFGKLLVVREDPVRRSGKTFWVCACDCGKEKSINGQSLIRGLSVTCGCSLTDQYVRQGDLFGDLTVVDENIGSDTQGNVICRVRCQCGVEVETKRYTLKNRKRTHCGCKNKTTLNEYNVWKNIKSRCYNENCEKFHHYGGRGIKVSEDWVNSFDKFYEDIGPKPSSSHSIERIDVNGDYSKENCYWARSSIQGQNKRKRKDCSSKYMGVSYNLDNEKWSVSVGYENKRMKVGSHVDEDTAGRMYDAVVTLLYGRGLCRTNFDEVDISILPDDTIQKMKDRFDIVL